LGEAGGEEGEAGSRGQSRLAGLAGQLRSPSPTPPFHHNDSDTYFKSRRSFWGRGCGEVTLEK